MTLTYGTLWPRCKGWLFHAFPHHLVSRVTYWLTRRETPLKDPAIRAFIRLFQVDMSEAHEPEPAHYPSFNAFFVRGLKPEARPIAQGAKTLASPADGRISQIGMIREGRLLQAKGRDYSLVRLLGGSPQRAAAFHGGAFCTIYLSPRDYHRVHMPAAGHLTEMVRIPGRLFSVAPYAVDVIPALFARNERVIALFETDHGPMAIVMIGAVNVAAIETVWHGRVTPSTGNYLQIFDYSQSQPRVWLDKGAELGRFNMGSTVIALFPPGVLAWDRACRALSPVKMGAPLGRFHPP